MLPKTELMNDVKRGHALGVWIPESGTWAECNLGWCWNQQWRWTCRKCAVQRSRWVEKIIN